MKIIKLYLILLFWVMSLVVHSQDLALYPLTKVPQANLLNPAYRIKCKFYLGVPALNRIKWNLNSSVSYQETFVRGKSNLKDSVLFNYENIYRFAKKYNKLSADAHLSWLDFGFAKKTNFFSFSVATHYNYAFVFAKDLMRLLQGNWRLSGNNRQTFDLSGTKVDFQFFHSVGVGWSKFLGQNRYAGIRLNYLNGLAFVHASKAELNAYSQLSPVQFGISPNYLLKYSLPGGGAMNNLSDFLPELPLSLDALLPQNNHGASIDLGFWLKQDKWQLAASALNLGGIFWSQNSFQLPIDEDILFVGENLRDYLNGNLTRTDIEQNFKDSLRQILLFNSTGTQSFVFMPAQFFLSYSYDLLPKVKLSIVAKASTGYRTLFYDLGANIVYQYKYFDFQLNTGYKNTNFKNLGLGVVKNFKHWQIYFFTENIFFNAVLVQSLPYILPYATHSFNFQLGINLKTGCNKSISPTDNKTCPAYF